MVHSGRICSLNNAEYDSGPIVYWMSRDQRVRENWALIHAQQKALEYKVPIVVIFCLVPQFLGSTNRQYLFMTDGLKQVERDLSRLNIPFQLLRGEPDRVIPQFLKLLKAGMLITDFDPLKIKRTWKEGVGAKIRIPYAEVDAHNIVPCRVASDKQEYAAYTIRPKIHRKLPEFLEPFPRLKRHPHAGEIVSAPGTEWDSIERRFRQKKAGGNHVPLPAGETAALNTLNRFLDEKLERYSTGRNDPNGEAVSGLSPYLHFGQISAQRIANEIHGTAGNAESKDAFLEELIVRKELSDNFCFYNRDYDSWKGFPPWAIKSLNEHRYDRRSFSYTLEQFENARTHDQLWNACQIEMVQLGKMHGYMRMYWAKKILEWSSSFEDAMDFAVVLNDRYELDGRDPNGYAGIAWAIGGVHDRAWFERPVFGKIRYMNERGCRSKFDVDRYIRTVASL